MFTNYLKSIEYVTVYPIVSLICFMALFIGVVIWALRADDKYIRRMEHLPLDTPADR